MGKTAENASLTASILRVMTIGAAALVLPGAALAEPAGEAIYRFYCYQCHGYAGDAQTLASASLSPPPRDHRTYSRGGARRPRGHGHGQFRLGT
jgi:mono/diheme cytochrome c family protein